VKNLSLKARLFGFLLFGGLLPVAVIAVFVFWYIQVRLYDRLGLELRIAAEDVRDKVDRHLFERYRDLKTLADDPALASSPESAMGQFRKGVPPAGSDFTRRSYRCLEILKADGTALSSLGECDAPGDWIRPSGAGPGAYFSKTRALPGGATATDVSLPVPSSGANAYELRATVELRSLSDLLVREKLPGGLDMDVVVYTPERLIVARKNGVAASVLADEFPVLTEMNESAADSRVGTIARGRPALAAVNTLAGLEPPLDALKWKVAIVQPLDDLSEPTVVLLQQLRRGIASVALIAVLGSLLCWALLFRSIMRSLNRLSEATQRVREGDLTTAIKVERMDELGRLSLFFNEMVKKLKASLDQLTDLAAKDGLTGLANRRSFDEKFTEELKRAQRYGHTLSLALLDVDHFKACNDGYGHAFGDSVLREIARICQGCCRETDFVARYGGEEIALILPMASKNDAAAVLERLRRSIEEARVETGTSAPSPKITVSIGVTCFPGDGASEKALLAYADAALYKAKSGGRNRVVRANEAAG
jgi:diguanylate cyclase (GGDEF)-like protein